MYEQYYARKSKYYVIYNTMMLIQYLMSISIEQFQDEFYVSNE